MEESKQIFCPSCGKDISHEKEGFLILLKEGNHVDLICKNCKEVLSDKETFTKEDIVQHIGD